MPYTPPNGNLADVDFAADGGYTVPAGNDADVDFAGGGGIIFITGLAATVSRGTFVPVVAGVPAGQQATASVGAFVPHITVALTGLQASVSSGTVVPSIDGNVSVNVDGLAATISGGTFTPALAVTLTGLAATTQQGFIPNSAILVGQQATVSGGVLTPALAVVLTGQAATAVGGTIIGGSVGELTTLVATVSGGVLTPSINVTLAGLSATASGGVLKPALDIALVTQVATVSGGVFKPALAVVLATQAATVSSGTILTDRRYANPIIWTASSYYLLSRYNDATNSRNRTVYGTVVGPYLAYGGYDTSQKSWRNEGQWYAEFVNGVGAYGTGNWYAGLGDSWRSTSNGFHLGLTTAGGVDLYGWSFGLLATENVTAHNGTSTPQSAHTVADSDVVMMAVDLDAGKLWFGINGTWLGGGNPATGANPTYTGVSSTRPITLMASLGTPGGASGQEVFIRAALDAMTYAIPAGFMPWETSDLNCSKALTTRVATVQQGITEGFHGVGVLTTQAATIQQGTLTPVITNLGVLVGQQLTATGRQFAAIKAGADITIPITYPTLQLTASVGALGQSLAVGVTSSTRKSLVTQSYTSQSVMSHGGAPSVSAYTLGNNFLPYNGVLKGGGEFVVNGYYVSPVTESSFYFHIDRPTQTFNTEPYFTSFKFDNSGGSPSTYDGKNYDFTPPTSYGGKISVGRDGITWGCYTRAYGRAIADTATPDVLHITTREHILGVGYYGGYIERLNVPSLDEADTLGIYAHDAKNFYIFYPSTSGADKVPAYRRYTGTGGDATTLATFNAEVQLTSFTGNSAVTALAGSMCVTRSGFGNTIYITYESGTGHIGLIVMDAVTETVTSHVLTAVVTPATTFIRTDERHLAKIPTPSISEVAILSDGTRVSQFLISAAEHFGGAWYSGTSAQTSTKPRVVHLSWTSATSTAPTMTLKAGPSDSSLAAGFESLEIRGDEVYHVLYKYTYTFLTSPDRWSFSYKTQSNDATGTGNTWTLASDATWTWIITYDIYVATTIPSLHFSGFGGGLGAPTVLMLIPGARYNYYAPSNQAWATLNYWGEANPLFSVLAYTGVGQVTISIVPGVVLNGQTLTASGGTLVPSISKGIGSGLVATVSGGTIVGAIPVDATVGLTGLQATVGQGALVITRGASLTGQTLTASVGTLAPTGHQFASLVGQKLTTSSGSVGQALAVTLAGAQLAVQHGLLTKEVAAGLTGQSLTTGAGVFVPALNLRLVGAQLQSGIGVFAPLTLVNLIGVQLAALDGSLQLALAVPLTGQSAVGQSGQLGVLYDCNVFATGVYALGVVGTEPTMTNVPAIGKDDMLWARAEVEKLFTQVSPDELFNNVEPRE